MRDEVKKAGEVHMAKVLAAAEALNQTLRAARADGFKVTVSVPTNECHDLYGLVSINWIEFTMYIRTPNKDESS